MKRGLLAGVVALGLLLGSAPGASAAITCDYVAAGPDGPRGNRLEIAATRFEEVVALLPGAGSNIRVMDDQRAKNLSCDGGKPTMLNLDLVSFTAYGRATGSSIFLAEAPEFGPGATPVDAGGKGITFVAKGPSISFGVGGTDRSDLIQIGSEGKATTLDFSPDPLPDGEPGNPVDARIYAAFHNVVIKGGPGHDVLGGRSTLGLMKAPSSIYGEAGDDEVIGGQNMDYLDGGPGADLLVGGPNDDQLYGGPGIDLFDARRGRDEIDAIDGRAETIKCGPGFDLARMDLKDNDRDCESFRFP